MQKLFSPLQGVQSLRLSNGLPVYLKPDPHATLVSIQMWVRVGSVDELPREAGLAHVLEHMLFKGSDRLSALQVAHLIESRGGGMNAETSKEYTRYYIDLPADGLDEGLKAMSAITVQASIPPEEWVREKPVILEEMKRRHDDPDTVLWDELNTLMYEDPRYARAVIGDVETVSGLTRDDLYSFFKKHYTTGQMTLVVSGAFTLRDIEPKLKRYFRDVPKGGRPERLLPPPLSMRTAPRRTQKSVHQVYLGMAFPTPSASHPDQEPLDLLAIILGEGQRARLVSTLREERQVVTGIHTLHYTQQAPGFFGIFAECLPHQKQKAIDGIYQELKQLSRKPIQLSELNRAKNILWNSWLVGYETPHQQASVVGHYAMEQDLDRLENYFKRIQSTTPRAMSELVKTYLKNPELQQMSVEPKTA